METTKKLTVYLNGDNEQLMTCPLCGVRTDFEVIKVNKQGFSKKEHHTCLNANCKHEFILEH